MHVKEVRKTGNELKKGNDEFKISDFDTRKNKILEELRNVKSNDIEYLVYRMQLIFD